LRDARTDGPHTSAAPTRELFASTQAEEPDQSPRGGFVVGVSIWLIAALCLVAGIVIGFGSGYTAGRRAAAGSPAPAEAAAADGLPELSPTYERRESSTFTEGTVSEPVRVDTPPIVPEPDVQPTAPAAVAPRPQAARAESPRPDASRTEAPRPAARAESPASGPGSLHVLSRPAGASVLVDGRMVGRTPLVLSGVSAGAHDVRLELAGFRRWSTSVEVRPGARARVAASLEQE
jgi:hypothetical protein